MTYPMPLSFRLPVLHLFGQREFEAPPQLLMLVTADATIEAIGVLLQTHGCITLASAGGNEVPDRSGPAAARVCTAAASSHVAYPKGTLDSWHLVMVAFIHSSLRLH